MKEARELLEKHLSTLENNHPEKLQVEELLTFANYRINDAHYSEFGRLRFTTKLLETVNYLTASLLLITDFTQDLNLQVKGRLAGIAIILGTSAYAHWKGRHESSQPIAKAKQ